jgi:hypothetical protein
VLNDTKSIFASRGVWGALIAVLAAGGGLLGYTITPDQQVQVVESVALIASGIGGLVALWGRISATKRLR